MDHAKARLSKRMRYFIHNNFYYNFCDINAGEKQFINVEMDQISMQKGFTLPQFIDHNRAVRLHELTHNQIHGNGEYADYQLASALKE